MGSFSNQRTRGHDKFKEPKVAERYIMFYRNRAVKCEGNVVMDDFEHLGLKQMFEERGWLEICEGHEFAAKDLVREFYANLYDLKHEEFSAKGYLRGITFDFTPDTIATFYHLPRVPNSGFPYAKDDWPSAMTVIQELCGTYNGGYKVSHHEMTLKARMLHKIVASIIIPTSYNSNLSADMTTILYAIVNGVEIDLAYFMWDAIFRVAMCPGGTEGLLFGSFITRWARSMGVPIGPDEEKQAKNATINRQTEKFSLTYVPRRDDTPVDVQQEVRGGVDLDLQSTIQELMKDTQAELAALHNDLVEFWAKFPAEIDALRRAMGLPPRQRFNRTYVPRRDDTPADVLQEVKGGVDLVPQSTIQELLTGIQAGIAALHNDLAEFWAEFRGEVDALRRDQGLPPRQRFSLQYVPRRDDTPVNVQQTVRGGIDLAPQPTMLELWTCIQAQFAALRNDHTEFSAEFQGEVDTLRLDLGLPPR